jgi:lipoprotein-releasing system permease protein
MKYLQHPSNREMLAFQLHENGYDIYSQDNRPVWRPEMRDAGWTHRRNRVAKAQQARQQQELEFERQRLKNFGSENLKPLPPPDSPFTNAQPVASPSSNPFTDKPSTATPTQTFDPATEQHNGAILGLGLSRVFREKVPNEETGKEQMVDRLWVIPGDDVTITIPMVGIPPKLTHANFTIVDLYESKMMEYDSKLVFVDINRLQDLRGMVDPTSGARSVSQILIKAKPGVELEELRDLIQEHFPRYMYRVQTWKDIQAPTIAAVFVELAILNVLMFLIIAVSGFGILGIFFMIVVEKTKDIGILKSLGAGSFGIMQIFLYYSLALGLVGSGGGVILGLVFVHYIKEIADFLSARLGHEIYDPAIYMFYEIPTVVQPMAVVWIVIGAIAISVGAGILPALRAAWMRPVESLRA